MYKYIFISQLTIGIHIGIDNALQNYLQIQKKKMYIQLRGNINGHRD
jgi:hypothetical protein